MNAQHFTSISKSSEVCSTHTDTILHHGCQGEGYAISAVCYSVILSVSRIAAKVISLFRWNLASWLGLPIRNTY